MVQEALVRLLAIDGRTAIANPHAYVIRSIQNIAIERMRRAKVVEFQRLAEIDILDLRDDAPDPFRVIAARNQVARLSIAIEELPERCRAIFVRRCLREQPSRQIAAIAAAFAEARERHGVLLFDEVDSLLFDRATARTSWEVGQVNELLTWLDRHPLPVVAATNYPQKLDPAALRRFVFKLDLQPLGRMRASRAFEMFFGIPAPASLTELASMTPGDFAIVKRQMRYYAKHPTAGMIVEALRAEVKAKPEKAARIGF